MLKRVWRSVAPLPPRDPAWITLVWDNVRRYWVRMGYGKALDRPVLKRRGDEAAQGSHGAATTPKNPRKPRAAVGPGPGRFSLDTR